MPKSNNSKGTLRRLYRYLQQHRILLGSVLIFALSGNICLLLGPKLIGQAIDLLAHNQGRLVREFWSLCLLLLLLFVVGFITQWLMQSLTVKLSAKVAKKLRQDFYEHINKLPLAYFDRNSHGKLTSLISTDIEQINDGLVAGLPQLFSGLVTLVGSIYLMFSIEAHTTLLLLVLTPISFLISGTVAKLSREQYQLEAKQRGTLNGLAEEIISNHSLIRTLQAGESGSYNLLSQYQQENAQLYVHGQKAQFYSSLTNPLTRLVNASTYILIGTLASYYALSGKITVGAIAGLLTYANQFSKPINEITAVTTQLQAAIASATEVFHVLDATPLPLEENLKDLQITQGAVEFEHVEFAYTSDHPLITDLNLSIAPGSKVAIVGSTGAGKTTLVNLLMRFYDLVGGRILIDGQDIAQVSRRSLRQQVGMVLQDIWLFKGTIAENICFALPQVDDTQMRKVCAELGIDDFINRLPQGYQTIIGEELSLSQGQKQLLTLARIMLQEPSLLILDEATSNIDTLTEAIVQRAFDQLMHGRTSFVIAHRLVTVKNADLVLVMEQGKIIERGTFVSLMQYESHFKELYDSQFAGRQL